MSKNISRLHNHVLTGHSKDFNSLLVILYLRNIYQPENTSELSTDDGSIKRRKTNEINFGGRFPYYLLLCHPYGYNHLKQRQFEVNFFALTAHTFTLLSLVDHAFFHKLTQDFDPRLHPAGSSKLVRSIIPAEAQSTERSLIRRLDKSKAVVISYDL